MTELHWMRPLWLVGVPLIIVLALWAWRGARARDGIWTRHVDPKLQPWVLAAGERGSGGALGATAFAAVLGCLALAGPSWERQEMPLERGGDAMVIALDLSRSMEATDLAPSRLARARLKLLDILAARRGGETALVVFSANAFVVTPLTSDTETIASQVMSLDSSLMPSRGSYPESGIRKSLQLLEQAEVRQGRVLLITDGGNLPPAMDAARELAAAGHQMSVLGVGTTEGGPIPAQRGGFVTDGRGNIALPRLERSGLERLATAGRGRYADLASDGRDLARLAVVARATSTASAGADDSLESVALERWRDAGPWLVLLCLPLVAWAMRRAALVGAFSLCLLAVSPDASARDLVGWFLTDDQRGRQALEAGEADRAAELFADPAWRATAQHRAGDYAASAQGFASLQTADGYYNQGTSLALAGDIQPAIAALQQALELDPEHEDARHNLELLESLPEPPPEQGEGGESTPGDGEPEEGGEAGDSDGVGEGQGGDSAQSGDEDGNGEASDAAGRDTDAEAERDNIEALMQALQEAEAAGDERAAEEAAAALAQAQDREEASQSLEQWLRRIPDDPGGLLRRKFRYQYQRRQVDQDGNALWPDDRSEPW